MDTKYNSQDGGKIPYIPTVYRYLNEELIIPLSKGLTPEVRNYNWGGGRNCGKTRTAINAGILIWMINPTQDVGIYVIRKEVQNKIQAYDTCLEALPKWYDFILNKSAKTIIGENIRIEVIGLTNQSRKKVEKIGLTRRNHDVLITIFDEAIQFEDNDFSNIMMSLGGGDNSIIFKTSNPSSPSKPFFRDFLIEHPFNDTKMRTRGTDWIKKGDTIWHWVNAFPIWNEGLLNSSIKKDLMAMPKQDYLMGEMYLWGKPVRLEGGVFSDTMHRAIKEVDIPIELFKGGEVVGGLDIGYSADKTALVIGAISEDESRVIVVDEFVIDSRKTTWDTNRVAYDILNFIENVWSKLLWAGLITIYCDNDFSFVDSLNEIVGRDKRVLKYNEKKVMLKDLIYFERVSARFKKEMIIHRIGGVLRALNNSRFHYINAPNLINEMNLYEWDTSTHGTGKKKPIDKDNHSIDALSYMLRDVIFSIGALD